MERSTLRRATLGAGLAALLTATGGCSRAASEPMAAPALATTTGPLVIRHLLTGELEAVHGVDIKVPKTTQPILRISWMVEDGSPVRAGDRLLEFDNATFADTVEETRISRYEARQALLEEMARSEEAVIEARMAVEQARIRLARAELAAAVPSHILSEIESSTRQLALERAQTAYAKALDQLALAEETADTEVRVKEIDLAQVERRLAEARAALGELVITAPVDGIAVVAEHPWEGRKLQVGDSPWLGLTVLRLPDLSRMRVVAHLFDVDDGAVAVGDPVSCTLDTYPEVELAGRIVDLTPVAQEISFGSMRRAFRVAVELEAVDAGRLRPGMSVRVEHARELPGALVLAPRAALDLDGDPPRARLAGGDWVEVVIGPCSAQTCVVEAGLDDGVELEPVG